MPAFAIHLTVIVDEANNHDAQATAKALAREVQNIPERKSVVSAYDVGVHQLIAEIGDSIANQTYEAGDAIASWVLFNAKKPSSSATTAPPMGGRLMVRQQGCAATKRLVFAIFSGLVLTKACGSKSQSKSPQCKT
jgi:hypothetical protein